MLEETQKPKPITAVIDILLKRLPIVLLVLGITSIGLIAATDHISRGMRQFYLYTDVVHEMEIELSKAHLALEENLRGIEGQDIALVWQGIDRSEKLALAALRGGQTLHGHAIKPLPDDGFRKDMESLRSMVVRFRELAQNVHKDRSPHEINSMDRTYHQFLEKAFILDEQFEELQERDEQRSKKLILLILVSWTGIIGAAIIGLWYRERLGRRMQTAIVNAKHQWEHTFDVIPDLIAIIDRDHRIVRANKAMAEKMGLAPKDILGKKCYELFHKTSGPIETCPHARLLHDSREHAAEIYEKELNAYFLVSVSPLPDDRGNLIGSVHVARDITAQKKNAETLKIKESAISSAINAIAIGDLQGNITYVNSSLLRMWGYEEHEIIGRSSHVLGQDEGDAREILDALRESGSWSGERMAKKKDGSVFPVELSANVVLDDSGNPLCLMASFMDISNRKRAEEEILNYRNRLEELVDQRTIELAHTNEKLQMEVLEHEHTAEALQLSENKFRQISQEFNVLLDAIPDNLVLMSPDLKITWANKSALQALNFGEALLSEHCFTLWHKQDRPCDDCPVLKSFRSGNAETSQLSTPDNRIWAVRAYPIKNDQGEVESVMELSTDITEKKSIQAEQMRANHLASIGELAAGVAHEINNPINGIINYAQIIVNSTNPEAREFDIAKRIIREGERISFIVTSLLSFARERKEEKIPVSVRQVLSDSLALAETQLKKSGITLRLDIDPHVPLVKVHAQQIQQVFLNVINNARYALSQKYPQTDPDKLFSITAGEVMIDQKPFVQIVFEDHGTGIPAHIIDKVMNPFYTTKPVGLGTGLGLSISHGIILDHNGRLSVESKEGAYTRIIVSLPAYKE
ncbi:MAG: PAS domain-containing protein [Nitrospirae bacterium]|nr:PAS domain-containing protein [Nitrospirota bacterium]